MATELLRPQNCLRRTPRSGRGPSRRPQVPAPGPVTILKRGQSLDSAALGREPSAVGLRRSASTAGPDLVVWGVERIGPDPDRLPRQIRFAGPAFAQSPAPSALPLPRFSLRSCAVAAVAVDDEATRDLRRLLGLD